MAERGHNRHGRKEGGAAVPLSRGAGSPSSKMWRLHPSSRLATIGMNQKLAAVPLIGGELRLHLTQRRLGQGLPPYQVAS